mgnify:FL=1|jgi:hypothetical protein
MHQLKMHDNSCISEIITLKLFLRIFSSQLKDSCEKIKEKKNTIIIIDDKGLAPFSI